MQTVMANRRWIKHNEDLGTGPVPAEPCYSPEFFESERDRIFRRLWINMGREEEIAEPGHYMVKELKVCNTSVLLVRGKDRRIRAFHNTCTHRGNRLVWDEKGKCPNLFVCNFHTWAFDMEGALKYISDEENFYDLDKKQLGLAPIHAQVWEGFIFINLSPKPEQDLIDYLAGMVPQIKGYPFSELRPLFTYRVEERANWKVIIDAQNEVYHLPFLHKRTYPDFCPKNEKHFSRIQDFRRFGRHTVYSVEWNPESKFTPLEQIVLKQFPYDGHGPTMIGWFDFYTVFPNFCMLFLSSTYITYNVWPLAADRSIWEIRMHGLPPANAGQRFGHEYRRCRLRDLLQEDTFNHEAIHESLASGAIKHLNFQDEEIQIRHFHKMVRDEVEGASRNGHVNGHATNGAAR